MRDRVRPRRQRRGRAARPTPGTGLRPPSPVLGAGPRDAVAAEAAEHASSRSSSRSGGGSTPRSTSRCSHWSAMLGALEALECGTTAIVDHHESPERDRRQPRRHRRGLREVGVRVSVRLRRDRPPRVRRRPARAGGERAVPARRRARAWSASTPPSRCTDETLEAAAGLAADLGVGVHVHVAEGPDDVAAGARLAPLARADWLIVHGVHLDATAARTRSSTIPART